MNVLSFSEQFNKSFSRIKDENVKKRIWKKVLQLEKRAPMGKKLKGNPYWSIRVDKFRVIYESQGSNIRIADILERKKDYREV